MSSPDDAAVADFLSQIETLPWFSNLGESLPEDPDCSRIQDWSEWPGPEDRSVGDIHYQQQALYDELMAGEHSAQLKELWDRIQAVVLRVAAPKVPYDSGQDTWHPPNMAVWHAAWTAGLMGLCLWLDHPIPSELRTQWEWFARGHWPCDWDGDFPSGRPVVY